MSDMVNVRRPRGRLFESGPEVRIGRSQFDRSHTLKTTFDADYLTPIYVDEVLPGDTFTCDLYGFARVFSPLLSPVMDNIEVETFFFFVPTRLLWDNWEYFQAEHDQKGAQDTTYTIPAWQHATVVAQDSLAGHMGIPVGLDSTAVVVNALPFRAYKFVYDEWFRDQGSIDSATFSTGNGPDTSSYGASGGHLHKSAKKHDYFTSALPYLQKGTAQEVALSGRVYVETTQAAGNNIAIYNATTADIRELDSDAARVDVSATTGSAAQQLYADLEDNGTVDINALRQATAIQRLLERDARGGTRYVESIWAHFGVRSPDYRLQRPEFLGGGKSYINVSPVANTSGVDSTVSVSGNDEIQGELRGVGTGVISGHGWAKSFTEHGYVLGIIRARGDVTYFQGLDKMWSRTTRYDFYIPALANLGEQAVLNKEIWVSNSSATDDGVFGYQERWSEYRYKQSRVQGKFNPDVSGALSHWHLAEDFSALPTLGQTFLESNTPMSRVQAVTTEPDFALDLRFNLKCARPIPVYSIPSLSGRF